MSRFTQDLRVIPRTAWIIAWFVYLCFTVPMFFFVLPTDPEIGTWPRWGQALFVYGFFLLGVVYVALIGYVYGDAKRRQMRYDVDAAGDLHSQRDRDYAVLHSLRPSVEAVPQLRECRKGTSLLSALWYFATANVLEVR
jgi:hypothetical protein